VVEGEAEREAGKRNGVVERRRKGRRKKGWVAGGWMEEWASVHPLLSYHIYNYTHELVLSSNVLIDVNFFYFCQLSVIFFTIKYK
jgi:hypothetical protein